MHLDGLDISFDATPPPEWLPPNMTLRHCDIKADIPEELVGVYDIVHIRHFIFVLLDDDLKPVLTNLIRLLSTLLFKSFSICLLLRMLTTVFFVEPGGYLQWGEPDIASFRIEKTNPGNKVDALSKLLKISQPQDTRFSPKWVPNLPTLFTDGGLENVQSDVRDAPPHLALAKHENALPVHEFIARKLRNEGLIQELKKLIPEVAKETRQGACWAFTRWTVVGRKPLGN